MKSLLIIFSLLAGSTVATTVSAGPIWSTCTPVFVGTFSNRVHVKCTASVSGIWYFAVPASDATFANRFMSIASTALVSGRPLQVFFDPADTSGNSFGCAASDCRKAQGLNIN